MKILVGCVGTTVRIYVGRRGEILVAEEGRCDREKAGALTYLDKINRPKPQRITGYNFR